MVWPGGDTQSDFSIVPLSNIINPRYLDSSDRRPVIHVTVFDSRIIGDHHNWKGRPGL